MIEEPEHGGDVRIVNSEDVPVKDFSRYGATKVEVKDLIDITHHSERFFLRLFKIKKGGHSPLDRHSYVHQVYVLKGRGLLRTGQTNVPTTRTLREGDTVFIPSNTLHQFINEREQPLTYLLLNLF